MWQKCPICDGSGNNNTLNNGLFSNICTTCKGKGIISQLTGLPPTGIGSKDYKNLKIESTDFRDNCEQQWEK